VVLYGLELELLQVAVVAQYCCLLEVELVVLVDPCKGLQDAVLSTLVVLLASQVVKVL
jgi:hypothetical protein